MKKILSFSFLMFLLAGMCTGVQMSAQADPQKVDYKKIGAEIPEFQITDRMGAERGLREVYPDRNYVVFLFNPTCGHCVDMAKLFIEHLDDMEENTIFFLAAEDMMEPLHYFANEVTFPNDPNFFIGVDNTGCVEKLYNYQTLPQINVYDHQHRLLKTHNGDWTWEEIKKYLK